MDGDEINANNDKVESKIELTQETIGYLNETRKWTIFLAILGFIFIGLMVIMSFSFGAIFSAFGDQGVNLPLPNFLFIALYIAMAILYFFPIFYLYQFSSFTKRGLTDKNENLIMLAFKNLKSHYKFIGVLTIIILSIYLLVFLGATLFGLLNIGNNLL